MLRSRVLPGIMPCGARTFLSLQSGRVYSVPLLKSGSLVHRNYSLFVVDVAFFFLFFVVIVVFLFHIVKIRQASGIFIVEEVFFALL